MDQESTPLTLETSMKVNFVWEVDTVKEKSTSKLVVIPIKEIFNLTKSMEKESMSTNLKTRYTKVTLSKVLPMEMES